MASDGNFAIMTLGNKLMQWFKDVNNQWTYEYIEVPHNEYFNTLDIAPDDNFWLTTTEKNVINFWTRDENLKWQTNHQLQSPDPIWALYIAPSGKYL